MPYYRRGKTRRCPLGPFDEEDPETEVIRPRNIQLLPGYLAALLIHHHGLNAKTTYQERYGAIQARGELDMCRDVLAWFRTACTAARSGGGALNGVQSVYHVLTPVLLPGDVYRCMTSKVRHDLPALAPPDVLTGDVTGTLAGALRALTESRGGRTGEAADRSTREPKSVQETYKETYRMLLRFTNVAQVEAVPTIWNRLAKNAGKSEYHTIMVQEFQRVCMARGLITDIYTPVVTASFKQMIVSLQFVGNGIDDLGTGCQTFHVSYSGNANKHYQQALEDANVSNQLAQGEQKNASLFDYRTTRQREAEEVISRHTRSMHYADAILCCVVSARHCSKGQDPTINLLTRCGTSQQRYRTHHRSSRSGTTSWPVTQHLQTCISHSSCGQSKSVHTNTFMP